MSWIFLKFLARVFRAALIPYATASNSECKLKAIGTHVTHNFYLVPKCCLFQWVLSLTDRLCSGGVYVLTEQMWFLPLVSCWEIVTRILIFCCYFFWSAWFALWCKSIVFLQDCKNTPPLLSLVSSCFIFVFALSQFSGPDYLEPEKGYQKGEKYHEVIAFALC